MSNGCAVRRAVVGLVHVSAALLWFSSAHGAEPDTLPALPPSLPEALTQETESSVELRASLAPFNSDLTEDDVRLDADEMTYDKERDAAVAKGAVKVVRGQETLTADMLEYRKKEDRVEAKGHVVWTRSDGTVIRAEEAEVERGMKEGVARALEASLGSGAMMKAEHAVKNGSVTVFTNASYIPCPGCASQPRPKSFFPLSVPKPRLEAKEAKVDDVAKRVTYKDVKLRLGDVPVMYFPYFTHAIPGGDGQTGFLFPSYRNDTIFGVTAEIPFYYRPLPQLDVTLTPVITENEGPALRAKVRHLLANGYYELAGSATNPRKRDANGAPAEGNTFRGHIEGKGKVALTEEWTAGFEGKRASDDTYLRKYRLDNTDVLSADVYGEFLTENTWFRADGLTFQSLEAQDDPARTPLIFPEMRFAWTGEPGEFIPHMQAGLEANAMTILRDVGDSAQRVSVKASARTSKTFASGHLVSADFSVRADGYAVSNRTQGGVPKVEDQATRLIPEAVLSWSYPLAKRAGSASYYVEPLVVAAVTPYGGNPARIVNEDSQDVEFNAANVFSPNRFNGYDRVETGPRLMYGVRQMLSSPTLGQISLLTGQTLRLREQKEFDSQSGLRDRSSDYVAALGYRRGDAINLGYEVRLDEQAPDSINSQSLYLRLQEGPFKGDLEYIASDDRYDAGGAVLDSREAALAHAQADLNDHWTMHGFGSHDLDNGKWISAGAGLEYMGECYGFMIAYSREFTRDRDIAPSTSVSVNLKVKNVTE